MDSHFTPHTISVKLKFILFIFFTCTILHPAIAQQVSGTIKGKLLTSDGQPAGFVTVVLQNTKYGTLSNENGTFQFKAPAGAYTLGVSFVGAENIQLPVQIEAGKTVQIADITINSSAQALKEVTVSTRKTSYKADKTSNSLRMNIPLLEAPQNIQVLTNTLIQDQQIFDMLEGVSRNVSGVTMQEHWSNYSRMNMRGARVAPFRNGMNVESNWGPLSEDMSFVERIEFVKGPAGFMLANGDPAGFYNVVTKKPTGVNRQAVNFTFGSFNTFRATADLDGKITPNGKLLYRLNLMGQKKDSWRDYEFNNRYSIAPVLKYQFSDKTSITAEYTRQFSRMSAIGSAYVFSGGTFGDLPRNFTIADPNIKPSNMHDNSAFLTFEHQFNPNWKLTAQGSYFHYNQRGSSLWISDVKPNGDMQRTLSSWDALNKSKFGQLFVNGEFKTAGIQHRVLGGLDYGNKRYIADWNQSFSLDKESTFNIYNPVYGGIIIPKIDRSKPLKELAAGNILAQEYGAIYVQDELGFFANRLRLTLAGRYTNAETNQYNAIIKNEKFTPRLGLSVSVDKSTSVYALYDQAFIPQLGRLANGAQVKPITGNNLEAGIKKDWFNGRWNSTVSAYQIIKNNQLVSDPTDTTNTYSLQLGQTKTKGIEFDVRGEIVSGLNLTVNYAYTDSEITKDTDEAKVGQKVPGYAQHVTNSWLAYRVNRGKIAGLGLSLGYQWQLSRHPWFVSTSTEDNLPDYFRLDGGLSYQFKKVNVALNVNNLLNDYLYSGSPYDFNYDGSSDGYYWQTEAPRNFRLSVGYTF